MNEDQYRVLEVIKRCLTGDCTPEEEAELNAWLCESAANKRFFDSMLNRAGREKREEVFARINEKEALKRFDRKIGYRQKETFLRRAVSSAAVALLAISTLFFLFNRESRQDIEKQMALLPGKKQATLVLSSGEEITLQLLNPQKEIARYAGVKVMNEEGKLVYQDSIGEEVTEQFNELITPRAGEYQVTLSDGTVVWLNADSYLRYPVAFNHEKREVHLTGEAYFEVAKDAERPFYVVANGVWVKVYGTEFNVNTHRREVVQTTLVSGRVGVRVGAEGEETILSPNQMLEYNTRTGKVDVQDVDAYNYVAWKSGEFMFDNERLEDIMRQLQLWYDIEVLYMSEELKDERFTGNVTRFVEIANVLNILERTGGVTFSVKGRSVTLYSSLE